MLSTVAIVRDPGGFELEDVELDEPREREILVRITAAGICHTDLVAREGAMHVPLPAVLGHEGAGIVERVGPGVTKVAPGDPVVLTFPACQTCDSCRSGHPCYCESLFMRCFSCSRPDGSPTMRQGGEVVHGNFFGQSSFGTYALASEANAVKVPPGVPLEILGPLGCGIQTGAGAVLNALRPRPGETLAVFGAGAVGLSAVMAARIVGCSTVVAVDVRENRLDLARELGATHTIDATTADPVAEIRRILPQGVAYSLEATGRPDVLRQAVDCLALRGVCGAVGAAPLGAEVRLDMLGLMLGRTVRGIIEGDSVPDVFIPQLIELYQQGCFPFDRLIRFFPFEEIDAAAAASADGSVVKPVVRMVS